MEQSKAIIHLIVCASNTRFTLIEVGKVWQDRYGGINESKNKGKVSNEMELYVELCMFDDCESEISFN